MEHDGIVAVGDICNGTSTFELKRNSRIHYHNFIEGFGLRLTDFSFLRRIAAESEALDSPPRSPPARHLFAAGRRVPGDRRSGKPCRYTLWKAAANRNFSKNRGPFTNGTSGRRNDRFRRIRIAGRTHRRLGPERKKNMLLVHNTFVTEQIADTLQHRFGNRLTRVLCPRSNDFIEKNDASRRVTP